MFWIAVISYLMMAYAVGGFLFTIKNFRRGYTSFGISVCIATSPLWIIGCVVGLLGLLLMIPLLYFQNFNKQNELNQKIEPNVFQKKFKPKFNQKNNKCEIKDL
jgi:hypothetical protein